MKILNVVGARPNFMKMAPILRAYRAHPQLVPVLVHTGQHHDAQMNDRFFEELGLPKPDLNLGVHGGSHAFQHAEVMQRFEQACAQIKPDLVLVVGDVNSTLSCALVAAKQNIPVAHVEAGLRAFDRSMPEEINRVLTDQLSDLLFVSEQSGLINLAREGLDHSGVHFVGNVMIDSLLHHLPRTADTQALRDLGVAPRGYALLTLHRPANVDDPQTLQRLIEAALKLAERLPVVFPVHPRTRARLEASPLWAALGAAPGVHLIEPLGYLDFLRFLRHCRLILTDSGGVQEESTVLRVPCVTLRESTERPSTCIEGTNRLVGTDVALLEAAVAEILSSEAVAGSVPARWDGRAAERIAAHLARWADRLAAGEPLRRAETFTPQRSAALYRESRV